MLQACGIRARLGNRLSNPRRNFQKTRSDFQARFPGPLPITIVSKGPENGTIFRSCFPCRKSMHFLHFSSSLTPILARFWCYDWAPLDGAAINMEGHRPRCAEPWGRAARNFSACPRVSPGETCMHFPPMPPERPAAVKGPFAEAASVKRPPVEPAVSVARSSRQDKRTCRQYPCRSG